MRNALRGLFLSPLIPFDSSSLLPKTQSHKYGNFISPISISSIIEAEKNKKKVWSSHFLLLISQTNNNTSSHHGNIILQQHSGGGTEKQGGGGLITAYDCTPVIGNIDFAVAVPTHGHQLFETEYLLLSRSQVGHLARHIGIVHTAHPHHRQGPHLYEDRLPPTFSVRSMPRR